DHPAFARLLGLAAARGLVVALALVMEDERMMHPLLRVPPVDWGPLALAVERSPRLRLVLLNALGIVRGERLGALVRAGDVSVEIAMLEGVGGVSSLLEAVPLDRVLFGSHAPCFNVESARLKLEESPLTAVQLRAVREGNARRLL